MLNRVSAYFSKHQFMDKLLQKKVVSSVGNCCLGISPQELSIVYMDNSSNKRSIVLCESYPYNDKNSLVSTLSPIVESHHLKNVGCSWVLQTDDYQMLVTDELPVKASEFQAAIRWKIKDLTRFPLNDVVIDRFSIPKTTMGSQNKMMLVVAQASKLVKIAEEIRESGLNLVAIDIQELGLRNLIALYEQDEKSTALIYIEEKSIQLLITYKKQIFVSRHLMFSLNNTDLNSLIPGIEQLTTQIQRSFEYYHNQWGQTQPSQIIFASTKSIAPEAIDLLSKNLTTPITILNIEDTLGCKTKLTLEQQGKFLPLIGGALREESVQ